MKKKAKREQNWLPYPFCPCWKEDGKEIETYCLCLFVDAIFVGRAKRGWISEESERVVQVFPDFPKQKRKEKKEFVYAELSPIGLVKCEILCVWLLVCIWLSFTFLFCPGHLQA